MIIHVEGLKKRYKNHLVLKEINITIDSPQIIALVGPNGAGKTTLLNCMTNLQSIHDGKVEILGKKHTDPSLFYDVSYLQDNRILYGSLTGYDHLKFICSIQKLPKSKIQEVAERVGMESYIKKRVRNYSLGMKQHLLLAMVIINEPKLLLMDEPLNGLDPTSAINMRRILLELHNDGTTIVVSSHNLGEIDRLTNTIYFMKDGALLKESLLEISSKHYLVTVNDGRKAIALLEEKKVPFTSSKQNQIEFKETEVNIQTFIDELNRHDVTIQDIEVQKLGAEKRYRELFEEEISS
jgi:ABC-2 type transport system ATP-binding protein